jgi:Ca2+-dependent lipid-binding protein
MNLDISAARVDTTDDAVIVDVQFTLEGIPNTRFLAKMGLSSFETHLGYTFLQGELRVIMTELNNEFPCFGAYKICFLKEPEISFSLSIGLSNTDLILHDLQGLEQWALEYVQDSIAESMIWPMTYDYLVSSGKVLEPEGKLRVLVKKLICSKSPVGMKKSRSCALKLHSDSRYDHQLWKSKPRKEDEVIINESFVFDVWNRSEDRLEIELFESSLVGKTKVIGSTAVLLTDLHFGKVTEHLLSLSVINCLLSFD